jgi:serine phosphatase RsbU (regulator of sigma subunit)/putative methionine-R-sulfoxide reductase with GAF domain
VTLLPQDTGRSAWRSVVSLGERLMGQSSLVEQRCLIVEVASQVGAGEADLWLAAALGRPSDAPDPLLPPAPLSEIVRQAAGTRRVAVTSPDDEGRAAAVAVPLVGRDTVLGVLQVRRPSGPPFTALDIDLLTALGIQCTISLDAAGQAAVQRWRVDQLALVHRVSAEVARVLNLDDLFQRVADLILGTFGYYYVALFTVEPDTDDLRFRASAGPVAPNGQGESGRVVVRVKQGEGIIGWVALHGAAIVANDVGTEPRYCHADTLPETRAEVALPLRIGERVLGVLDVQGNRPNAFDETDLMVLHALADNVAVAVEDARLYGDLRRRAEHLFAVADVSRAVTSILDQEALLREVVSLIHKRFGYPYVHLFTVRQDTGQLVYRAGSGARGAALRARGLTYDVGNSPGIIPWVASHAETVMANDVTRDQRYRPSPLPPATTRSELAVPLLFGGRVLGVLDVQSNRVNAFTEDDRFLFEALADNVAVALRNADLYHSEQWRRRAEAYASAAVLQVTQSVARLNDLDEMLEVIVRATPLLVGVRFCIIFLWDEESACFRTAKCFGVPPAVKRELLGQRYAQGEFPLLDRAQGCSDVTMCWPMVSPGQPPDIPDGTLRDLLIGRAADSTHQILAIPLSVKAHVFGAMLVEEAGVAPEAREKWLEILSDIGQQAALSIQSHRWRQEVDERERMERELLVAGAIQQTLMPRDLPGLQGWEMAVAWQPARQVGGDFYDFFELPGGRLGLVIADVADKGLPAALFMALTRALVRAAALTHTSPAAALRQVNDLMVPDAHRGMFVTAVYGTVVLDSGRLVYANAGHLPPLVWRYGAQVTERAGKGGLALGVMEHSYVPEQTIDLEPGDSLILYTDGVTDAASPAGDTFGAERLRRVIQESGSISAQSLLRAVDTSVVAFAGGTAPADDLTLAVLRRLPGASCA